MYLWYKSGKNKKSVYIINWIQAAYSIKLGYFSTVPEIQIIKSLIYILLKSQLWPYEFEAACVCPVRAVT